MIVVDTNVIAYLLLGGDKTNNARALFKSDSKWCAPILWKSEFRNVLAHYIRLGKLSITDAINITNEADILLQGEEYQVNSAKIFNLIFASKCSAYDCEFVALAQHLNIPLITSDKQVLKEFAGTAFSLETYI